MANISTSAAEEIISSACLAESTATLSLEVTDYLQQLKGLNVAEYVSSRVSSVGGYDWEMRFYPQGIKEDCGGNASVLLWCVSQPAEDVGAKFTLSMVEKKSRAQVASFNERKRVFTSPRYNLWGHHRFVEKSRLESLSQRGDGCFTVQCVLTVVSHESPPPPLDLQPGPRLERMLRDGIGTDVVLDVAGREFRAHRSLLAARSSVFDVRLFGPTAAERMEVVDDVEPDIFEMMLHYIYTDSLPECRDDGGRHSVAAMQSLLSAATRYGLDRLKLMCKYELYKTRASGAKKMAAGECVPEINKWLRNCTESTATLSLEVSNYLQLKDMGGVVRSPVFRVGGYDWEIKFYPDGEDKPECEGNASCYLYYLGQAAAQVSAKCTFSMLGGKHGQEEEAASHSVSERVFCKEQYSHVSWGYAKFVDKAKLESLSQQQGGGCFTVLCTLTVTNETGETPRPPMELPDDLEGMLGDERGMDVAFSVCGQEFRAHRFVLAARLPFFMAQLFGQMKEKDMRCLDVLDMVPCIFEKMLRYIYTGSLPRCEEKAGAYSAAAMQHLLVAADRYGLERLKLICEEELCKMLDTKIVSSTLNLAEQHHCKRLKDACLKFVSEIDEGMILG